MLQPDLKWCGGLSEAVKIYTIAEAAGIVTIPHGGGNTPFGQHFAMALPESPMAEYWLGTDPWYSALRGVSPPRHGDAKGRLLGSFGCAGIWYGDPRGMDNTVGAQVNPVDRIDGLIDDPREYINYSWSV